MQMEDQAIHIMKRQRNLSKALEFAFKYNVYANATAEATRRLGEPNQMNILSLPKSY